MKPAKSTVNAEVFVKPLSVEMCLNILCAFKAPEAPWLVNNWLKGRDLAKVLPDRRALCAVYIGGQFDPDRFDLFSA